VITDLGHDALEIPEMKKTEEKNKPDSLNKH
jgi:hypothetical protein